VLTVRTTQHPWWRLAGVAVLVSLGMAALATATVFLVGAATYAIWSDPERSSRPLEVVVVLLLLLFAAGVGVAVGQAVELRTPWLLVPAIGSILGGFGTGLAAAAFDQLPTLWATPGLAVGSLLGVALARRAHRRRATTDVTSESPTHREPGA
jgi:hypothetical protein